MMRAPLRLEARPSLGPHRFHLWRHRRAISNDTMFGGPLEGHRNLDTVVIGADFQFLPVPYEGDNIALIDHPDGRLHAAVAICHDIGLHCVIGGVGMPDEGGGSLKEDVVQRFDQHLAAIHFADVPFEARADPGKRRVGKGSACLNMSCWIGFVDFKGFKVFAEGQAREHSGSENA